MSNQFEEIKKYFKIPKQDSEFIKTITIGVPYVRMYLNILTRKKTSLPIIHETILSLLDTGWENYLQISQLMGINKEMFEDIVTELETSDYITHSGDSLKLKKSGAELLETLELIKIEAERYNDIYVSLIDNTILDLDKVKYLNQQIASNIYLEFDISIDDSFALKIEPDIKEFYDNNSIISLIDKTMDGSELYRFVKLQNYNYLYAPINLDIYKDKNNRLEFYVCTNKFYDVEDKGLIRAIENQFYTNSNFLKIYDNEYFIRQKNNGNEINFNYLDIKEFDCSNLNSNLLSNIIIKNKDIKDFESILSSNRILFYKEYQRFLDISNKKVDAVYIVSDKFNDLSENNNLLNTIQNWCNLKVSVNIFYMEGDFNTENFVKKLKSLKNNNHITFKIIKNITYSKIIIEDMFCIDIYYEPVKVENNTIFKEISIIYFDAERISAEINDLEK